MNSEQLLRATVRGVGLFFFVFRSAVLQNAWRGGNSFGWGGGGAAARVNTDAFVGVGSCSSLVIGRRFNSRHHKSIDSGGGGDAVEAK